MTTVSVAPTASGPARRRRPRLAILGVAPFALYTVLFLFIPAIGVLVGAFRSNSGSLTSSNVSAAFSGVYLTGLENSVKISVVTAVLPGVFGLLIAQAVHLSPKTSVLHRMVSTASGVFANFGGVPLAFLFEAVIGSTGALTGWMGDLGFNIYSHGFDLYTLYGVELVYMYFQIPLMVLVITPALDGLKPSWREASDNLGAGSWSYWRLVGIPVLLPSVLGGMLLLFGSAMSAYATADALTSGGIAITSIQIGSFLNGNVIAGQENIGKALGLALVLIVVVVMGLYTILQRRAARWSR